MMIDEIVLVHGAWHGQWTWDFVEFPPEINVKTPRLNYADANVTLLDHAEQVLQAVTSNNCALVAHSYGGFPTTLAHQLLSSATGLEYPVIYVDAALPRSANSMVSDTLSQPIVHLLRITSRLMPMIAASQMIKVGSFVDYDPELTAWLEPRLRPFPLRLMVEQYPLSSLKFPRRGMYMRCDIRMDLKSIISGGDMQVLAAAAENAGCDMFTYDEPHNIMMTAPDRFVDDILDWLC